MPCGVFFSHPLFACGGGVCLAHPA
ncbi:hypothetical protein YPPY89_3035, partial [Yersinia pestis PY-89]